MSVSSVQPPVFDAPFRLDQTGQVVVVEQDSPAEIGAAVYDVIVCPVGANIADPGFGIPSPIFASVPLDTTAIAAAVQALEPRASTTVVQQAISRVQALQPVELDVTSQVQAGS